MTEFGIPKDDARWLELVQQLLLAKEKIPWTLLGRRFPVGKLSAFYGTEERS
jgi:hypothetical protein